MPRSTASIKLIASIQSNPIIPLQNSETQEVLCALLHVVIGLLEVRESEHGSVLEDVNDVFVNTAG